MRRSPPARSGRGRRGFSLIELLIVVAIIASLLGMLAPVVGLVRDQARRITFANNQRQAAMGVLSYADDSDGRTPCMFISAARTFWFQVVQTEYLGLPAIDFFDQASIARSPFRDPADKTMYPGWNRGCINLAIGGRVDWDPATGQWWGSSGWQVAPVSVGSSNRLLTSIAHPSQMALLMPGPQSANVSLGTEFRSSSTRDSGSWVGYSTGPSEFLRYRGTAPIVFVDAHVETFTAKTFWDELLKDSTAGTSRLFDSAATNP